MVVKEIMRFVVAVEVLKLIVVDMEIMRFAVAVEVLKLIVVEMEIMRFVVAVKVIKLIVVEMEIKMALVAEMEIAAVEYYYFELVNLKVNVIDLDYKMAIMYYCFDIVFHCSLVY